MGQITVFDILLRLLSAIVVGFIVGAQRARTLHPAGIRTHILVALGSPHFVPFRCSAVKRHKKRALQHSKTAVCKAPNVKFPAAHADGWCA